MGLKQNRKRSTGFHSSPAPEEYTLVLVIWAFEAQRARRGPLDHLRSRRHIFAPQLDSSYINSSHFLAHHQPPRVRPTYRVQVYAKRQGRIDSNISPSFQEETVPDTCIIIKTGSHDGPIRTDRSPAAAPAHRQLCQNLQKNQEFQGRSGIRRMDVAINNVMSPRYSARGTVAAAMASD